MSWRTASSQRAALAGEVMLAGGLTWQQLAELGVGGSCTAAAARLEPVGL